MSEGGVDQPSPIVSESGEKVDVVSSLAEIIRREDGPQYQVVCMRGDKLDYARVGNQLVGVVQGEDATVRQYMLPLRQGDNYPPWNVLPGARAEYAAHQLDFHRGVPPGETAVVMVDATGVGVGGIVYTAFKNMDSSSVDDGSGRVVYVVVSPKEGSELGIVFSAQLDATSSYP